MAIYQLVQREMDRRIAAAAAGKEADQRSRSLVTSLPQEGIAAIMKMLGGQLQDSALMEIVNPATGRFWHQDGISMPGGTDDARP